MVRLRNHAEDAFKTNFPNGIKDDAQKAELKRKEIEELKTIGLSEAIPYEFRSMIDGLQPINYESTSDVKDDLHLLSVPLAKRKPLEYFTDRFHSEYMALIQRIGLIATLNSA